MAFKKKCPVPKKIKPNEPMFVLRAQDISAPEVILFWLMCNPDLPPARRLEAFKCAELMRKWPFRKPAD